MADKMGLLQGRRLNSVQVLAIQLLAQFNHEQDELKWDKWNGLLSRVSAATNPNITLSATDLALWFPDDEPQEVMKDVSVIEIEQSEGEWDFSQAPPVSAEQILAMRDDVMTLGVDDLDLRPDVMREPSILKRPKDDDEVATLIRDAYEGTFGGDGNGAWH